MDYKVYDDVLIFDVTYETNKYHCPLVVFFGVTKHNHSFIFTGFGWEWDEIDPFHLQVVENHLFHAVIIKL